MNSSARLFRIVPAVLVGLLSLAGCSGNVSPSAVPQAASCSTGSIAVFKDAFHTQPLCQFNVASSTAAYVLASNVAPADYYVMYIRSAGTNSRPVFTTHSEQAPSGSMSFTWPLKADLKPGQYTITVYDQTTRGALGIVQVSLTE